MIARTDRYQLKRKSRGTNDFTAWIPIAKSGPEAPQLSRIPLWSRALPMTPSRHLSQPGRLVGPSLPGLFLDVAIRDELFARPVLNR